MNTFKRAHKLPNDFKGSIETLIFCNQKLFILRENESAKLFFTPDETKNFSIKREFVLTFSDAQGFKAVVVDEVSLPSEGELYSLRDIYKEISEESFRLCAIAQGFVNWEKNSRYCGHCGGKTIPWDKDNAMKCPDCNSLYFPRISPAVIIAIQKDNEVLLAHNHNFRSGLYGLIAGFIETGETAEEAVVREIEEEVGIEVKDITYHMSQAWPFPDSLMFGFSAKWKSGEIQPDGVEILDAQWFSKDKLPPELPGPQTIAGALFRKITGYEG